MTTRLRRFIGNTLRDARANIGISLRDLEKETGVDKSTMHDWEIGKTDITVAALHKLSHVLGPRIVRETYLYLAKNR